jgi:diacylglycerol kinase
MRELLKKHKISFKNAFAGIAWAIRTQPNFRVHITFSILAIFLAAYFRITHVEWTIIIFTIILGLTAELINTALESMTDLITTEWRQEAKVAKDVAAGMMLTVAAGAVIVACFVFLPYL